MGKYIPKWPVKYPMAITYTNMAIKYPMAMKYTKVFHPMALDNISKLAFVL
jgi:hypothetical protein